MASMNRVTLIGRLTKDPELRYTAGGVPVANFSLAVDRNWGKEKQTDFFFIVAWQKLAEICQQYVKKGRLVAIEGRLQSRSYETQDGQKRNVVEVVASDLQLLDRPKSDETGSQSQSQTPVAVGVAEGPSAPPGPEPPLTDDVPF